MIEYFSASGGSAAEEEEGLAFLGAGSPFEAGGEVEGFGAGALRLLALRAPRADLGGIVEGGVERYALDWRNELRGANWQAKKGRGRDLVGSRARMVRVCARYRPLGDIHRTWRKVDATRNVNCYGKRSARSEFEIGFLT